MTRTRTCRDTATTSRRTRRASRTRAVLALTAATALLAVAACTPAQDGTDPGGTSDGGTSDGDSSGAGTTPVTLGLTYVPDIQFAPFYVAEANGYYDEAGFDVELRHHGVNEGLFTAIEQGAEDLVVASGDEVLTERATGGDLAQIATLYQRSPVALLVPEDSAVETPDDLAGLTIGVPGEYGATWLGLLTLLDGAGLSTADVTVQSIGFTQTTALLNGDVDAVMGYVNGDAVRLAAAGMPVRALEPGALVSVGVALPDTSSLTPEQQEAFVTATLRGVEDTIADPEAAVEIAADVIPGMTSAARTDALAVLEATVPLLSSTGTTDPAQWDAMAEAMLAAGMIEAVPDGGYRNAGEGAS
ncbi:ABC transporter substrate-binding protein [Serinibacter arcticus]|uniref:Hydroxymethylpyrimidine ABC transporter, substrate-binding component n=1 Tax=Serinibacter arcticus TaxID=1655435 RepID=A0A4Z1DYT9_9MICO|nr:ABC transporter substrate-binding protein [Serinibacter arcticus]TGO04686.1 Hydroxymethylpyrimidine ABC transporter, substrate-binding component [Serinibacter arcticus]